MLQLNDLSLQPDQKIVPAEEYQAHLDAHAKALEVGEFIDHGKKSKKRMEASKMAQEDERLTKLEADMDSLKEEAKKKDEALASKDKELTKLKAELAESVTKLTAELDEAKKAAEDGGGKEDEKKSVLQKQLDEASTKMNEQLAKFSEMEKAHIELTEDRRMERVKAKAAELKFPALRAYAEVIYETATRADNAERMVKFSINGDDVKEMTVEAVMDEMVVTLNKLADNKLFSDEVRIPEFNREDTPADENPRTEVNKRVLKYCTDKGWDPAEKYEEAETAIFIEDPALKKAYANS